MQFITQKTHRNEDGTFTTTLKYTGVDLPLNPIMMLVGDGLSHFVEGLPGGHHLRVMNWTDGVSQAWHKAIPNLSAAMDALLVAAQEEPTDEDDESSLEYVLTDFMEGLGASEDHELIRSSLMSVGLRKKTAERVMMRIVGTNQRRVEAEVLARRFHAVYERLAPEFEYVTRPETRHFDPNSKNGALMIAVCNELLGSAESIFKLRAERDDADRRAGAAERTSALLEEEVERFTRIRSEMKRQWGVDECVSFDKVWEEALELKKARGQNTELNDHG